MAELEDRVEAAEYLLRTVVSYGSILRSII
jgi:hypothetical protein